ncbi:MAG: SDR family NAD(P)-dependent oxidoreductase [Bacteroidales bacterium]|nr:SDR family NAD(P)-dependent oxidoreductase [Bacteroidales bacterium]
MKRCVFITGATSGFGEAMAIRYAENGDRLIINGRREERLRSLAGLLEKQYNANVLPLPFDVRDRDAVTTAINSLDEAWRNIDILINNAGLAVGLSKIQNGDYDDWDRMLDTNVKGLLNVTRNIAPLMIENKKGHIINIGSIAGKEVYPMGNVYCASKHAVDAITKALRIELVEYGIKVTQIAPGAAETEFSIVRYKGDKEAANKVYDGYTPLSANDIAEIAWFITSLPPHVNINDIVVMPTAQASPMVMQKDTVT